MADPELSELEWDCLRILDFFGPCSNAEIGRKMDPPGLDRTYKAVQSLVAKGLATHPKKQTWEITKAGKQARRERNGFIQIMADPKPCQCDHDHSGPCIEPGVDPIRPCACGQPSERVCTICWEQCCEACFDADDNRCIVCRGS